MSKTLVGIYKIENIINNHFYIGSAANLCERFNHHLGRLKNNRHKNQHLQKAWNKYGQENFKFRLILMCERFELLRYEQELINKLSPDYNICKYVKSKLGWKTPEEVKQKIRFAQLGKKRRPRTEEEKRTVSLALSGRKRPPFSESWKNKIRLANLGKKLSGETKMKIGASNKGHFVSEVTKERISNSNKGKNAKTYKGLISPNGTVYKNIINLSDFCKRHELFIYNMHAVATGRRKSCKGWISL